MALSNVRSAIPTGAYALRSGRPCHEPENGRWWEKGAAMVGLGEVAVRRALRQGRPRSGHVQEVPLQFRGGRVPRQLHAIGTQPQAFEGIFPGPTHCGNGKCDLFHIPYLQHRRAASVA